MINLKSNRLDIRIKDVFYKTESTVQNTFFREHRPSNSLVFYTKGGHIHTFSNGEPIISNPYDILYLPYGSTYSNEVKENRIEYYQVDFEIFENNEPISLFDDARIFKAQNSLDILSHFVEIFRLNSIKTYLYNVNSINHLLCIIVALFGEEDSKKSNAQAQRRIRSVLSFLNERYTDNTDVKALASMADMSVSGLEKNFIKATGKTPIAYRNDLRIEQAKLLLIGGFSISEVSEMVGFSDLYYFAKTFKRITGMTPGKFARQSKIT